MIQQLINRFKNRVKSSLGWSTFRKLLVIESDDWGSIRMPSRKVYNSLVSHGIKLDSPEGNTFNMYDTLADEDDLTGLFEVLTSVKDKNNRPAVFTAVSLAANPDFEKIEKENFNQYFYEPFTTTLSKYQNHNRTFGLWKEGMEQGIFYPQSHSREHLDTISWMENLRQGDNETMIAFKHGMWAFDRANNQDSFQIAFNVKHSQDVDLQKKILEDGLNLFEKIFGYKSKLFVPPNGIMHKALEKTASQNGIKYLFAATKHLSVTSNGSLKSSFKYLGKKNLHNQRYLIRNCSFEPNLPGDDWVDRALGDISRAFKYRKPAILGPHRKNFIGGIEERNRKDSLDSLKRLLARVVKQWPEVEFVTSEELGLIMEENSK